MLPGFLRVPYDDIAAVRQLAEQRDDIVAVLLEPVQGEGGIRVAGADYLRDLRALCDRHGWLLMLDEIQAGMGRTGAWFGHQHAGIAPDVMTLAKALGNGFPIGACLARGPAADLFSPGQHGSTFGGNPLACRVACTVLDIMARDGMPQRAALGQRLLAGLRRALEGHPQVVAVRGQGLMAGIELDRNCQELVGRALAEQRLLITVTRERTIRLLPPLVCDEAQIDEIVARLARMLSGDSAQAITPSNAAGPSPPARLKPGPEAMTIASPTLQDFDPELAQAMRAEAMRQEDHAELIASENYASPLVMAVQDSVFTNKYAEGYPPPLLQRLRARGRGRTPGAGAGQALFDCDYANVQPHAGAQANAAVFLR